MAGADVSLKSLESQLGKQLQHLPFDRLETKHLADEPDALSFKILLGYIKAESDNDKLETWVHFYPIPMDSISASLTAKPLAEISVDARPRLRCPSCREAS
jgi:hypothetical protein